MKDYICDFCGLEDTEHSHNHYNEICQEMFWDMEEYIENYLNR